MRRRSECSSRPQSPVDEIVVGRSRSADLSVRRATKFLERMDRNDLSRSEAWRTVSRQHARIAFYRTDHIVIEDLSANGTFVDGISGCDWNVPGICRA